MPTNSTLDAYLSVWNEDLVAANHLAEEDWLEAGRQLARETIPLVSMDEQLG